MLYFFEGMDLCSKIIDDFTLFLIFSYFYNICLLHFEVEKNIFILKKTLSNTKIKYKYKIL